MYSKNPKVWVKADLLAYLFREAELFFPKETGGLILGYYDEFGDIAVTNISTAGGKSVHGDFEYIPDYEYDQKITEEIFEKSKGVIRYLGDWHTHPFGTTDMSEKDKSTLKKIAHYKESQLTAPLMMIIGLHPVEIAIWSYGSGEFRKFNINFYKAPSS